MDRLKLVASCLHRSSPFRQRVLTLFPSAPGGAALAYLVMILLYPLRGLNNLAAASTAVVLPALQLVGHDAGRTPRGQIGREDQGGATWATVIDPGQHAAGAAKPRLAVTGIAKEKRLDLPTAASTSWSANSASAYMSFAVAAASSAAECACSWGKRNR